MICQASTDASPRNQALFQLSQLTGLIDAWPPQLPAASYAKAGAELGVTPSLRLHPTWDRSCGEERGLGNLSGIGSSSFEG